VQYLFDSRGRHIANEVNGELHAPGGSNIGHCIKDSKIFIDMRGRYLGEIVQGNRLLYDRQSPHRSTNYGSFGSYGSVGSFGSPGSCGSIGMPGGYEDVDTSEWMGRSD